LTSALQTKNTTAIFKFSFSNRFFCFWKNPCNERLIHETV